MPETYTAPLGPGCAGQATPLTLSSKCTAPASLFQPSFYLLDSRQQATIPATLAGSELHLGEEATPLQLHTYVHTQQALQHRRQHLLGVADRWSHGGVCASLQVQD